MTANVLQVTGTRGEVAPEMHARVDTDFYKSALKTALNTVVTRFGAHVRVPGTTFDGFSKIQNRKHRMLKFEFSQTQVYAVEVGHLYMRFWTPNGQVVTSPGNPYEIATPFTEADLPYLHGRQSGDVLYIYSRGRHNVQMLKRLGETNWAIEAFKAKDGPYLPPNKTGTTLRPSQRGSAVPVMTSNTSPSGTVTGASSTAFWVFNPQKSGASYHAVSDYEGSVVYTFGSSIARVVDAYYVRATSIMQYLNRTPSAWEFQGWNGSSWVTLDTRSGENGWGASEVRFYEFLNETPHYGYRFMWTSVDGNTDNRSLLQELGLHERGENQVPFSLYASSTQGINNNAGFNADDVGRNIRLLGSDGQWRYAEITSVVSVTEVKIRLYPHALPDTNPISNWHLGTWSKRSGWPYTGIFYEDRHTLAGSNADPIGIWMSRSADYDFFGVSQPLVDDDGVSLKLTGGGLDPVRWLAESGTLLAGTAGVLRSIGNRDSNEALSATNVRQRKEVQTGSAEAQPAMVENVVLFIDRLMTRLYEGGYSYEADGYITREVSTLNEHLFEIGVTQVDYVDAPHKMALCLRTDGKVIAFAYDREQKVAGATLLDFGGVVEDIMVMPGSKYDDVWLSVRRPRGAGQNTRHIERLADFWKPTTNGPPVYSACSFVITDDEPFSGLTGLTALRNRTVGVWADGVDIGDYVVANNGTLDLEVDASTVVVGERMPFRYETLRLPSYGQPDGSGLGRKMRVVKAMVDVMNSAGVWAGSLQQTDPLRVEEDAEHNPDDPTPLRTGMIAIPVDDRFANEGQFVVHGESMYPATIRAIELTVEGEP